jgi:hypothetical protein
LQNKENTVSEQPNNRCFVLLPAGDPHYARLFDELFAFAIIEAGLQPYRHESPSAPLPIEVLVQEIIKADAIFADLSRNDVDIWFALGCALTLRKPLCVISSRLEFSLPLDIQDLEIIPYPVTPFPGDYRELQQSITEQLQAKLPKSFSLQSAPPAPAEPPVASSLAPAPSIVSHEELTSYEVLALTIIDIKATEQGLSPRALGLEMQSNDSAHLTSHAMNALKRRKLIERRSVQVVDGNELYISENLFITRLGEEWLIRHGKRKSLIRSTSAIQDLSLTAREG